MKKTFTAAFLTITMLFIENLALSQGSFPDKVVLEKITYDNINYERYQYNRKEDDGYVLEHVIEGDNKKWDITCDIKLPAFLAYLNIKKISKRFAEETSLKLDSNWTKVLLSRPNDTIIECFAKEDCVIHISCQAKNHLLERKVEYLYTTNPELVDLFVGSKIFGLDANEFFKSYGYTEDYTREGINKGYLTYVFTLVDNEENQRINFHFKDNKINGISFNLIEDINLEKYSKDFQGFVSPKISEGLYTKGFCVRYKTKLRENPLKTTITSKIDLDSVVYILDYKEIEGKGTWVRLVTPEGIEGWTEGENISPSIHCFSEASRLNATFDYLFDLKFRLSGEAPTEVKVEKVNVLNNMKTKIYDGVEISELYAIDWGEDEENKEAYGEDADEEDDEEDDDGELVKILITKPFADFAGFKVGSSVEDLKKLSDKLSVAGWEKMDRNEIKKDGIYTWYKKEKDYNSYTKGINIKIEGGKASSIELVNLEAEY